MSEKRDLVIIGAGPGGYVAAIRASQLGAKATLIEKDTVGGTCLNWGCIPTKSILASTHLFTKIQKAQEFGIEVPAPALNWPKVIERKDRIVHRLVKGIEYLLKKNKIEVIKGEAKLLPNKKVEIKNTEHRTQIFEAQQIILATGSQPAEIPGYKIDHKKIIDSTDALSLKELPKSMTIIGGGVMGVEFAALFSEAGVKVTIIEALDRLLPKEDIEISNALTQSMKQKGITIKTSSKEIIDDEKILITIGRKLNIEGFEEAGIKLEYNRVLTNENMETNIPGIYAIGDITSPYQLAHVAMHQGKIAANQALHPSPFTFHHSLIPYAIFTHPEIARIGLTEEEAKQTGKIKKEKFPFMALGKAAADGEKDGFIKIITNEQDFILGAHIIGSHASLLIPEIALAIQNNLKAHQIMETIHIHPTLSEGLEEAVASIYGKAIHI